METQPLHVPSGRSTISLAILAGSLVLAATIALTRKHDAPPPVPSAPVVAAPIATTALPAETTALPAGHPPIGGAATAL
ncbi:MAG: hypothetical protein ABI175_03885, partial [Polyangiales bacterium]